MTHPNRLLLLPHHILGLLISGSVNPHRLPCLSFLTAEDDKGQGAKCGICWGLAGGNCRGDFQDPSEGRNWRIPSGLHPDRGPEQASSLPRRARYCFFKGLTIYEGGSPVHAGCRSRASQQEHFPPSRSKEFGSLGLTALGYRMEVSEGAFIWFVVGRLRLLDLNDAPVEMQQVQTAEAPDKAFWRAAPSSAEKQSNWEVWFLSMFFSFPFQTQHPVASWRLTECHRHWCLFDSCVCSGISGSDTLACV